MKHYLVEFDFVENGHTCHTAYGGKAAHSEEEAIAEARDWFGFDRDGIRVIKTTVRVLGED